MRALLALLLLLFLGFLMQSGHIETTPESLPSPTAVQPPSPSAFERFKKEMGDIDPSGELFPLIFEFSDLEVFVYADWDEAADAAQRLCLLRGMAKIWQACTRSKHAIVRLKKLSDGELIGESAEGATWVR